MLPITTITMEESEKFATSLHLLEAERIVDLGAGVARMFEFDVADVLVISIGASLVCVVVLDA